MRRSLPPVPLTLAFVDCINHRDLPGLVSLMSNDHHLQVFDETPVTGRDDNERAWSGYFDGEVAVLGHTTGQQLDARRGHAP